MYIVRILLSGSLILTLSLVTSMAQAGLGTAKERVLEELASQDIDVGTSLDLIDLEDLFGVELGLEISVRPNRDKETYSRFESIDFQASLKSGFADIAPLFVTGLRGRNVKVVRQFQTQKDAFNLVSYPSWTWRDLPYNAKNAMAMPKRTLVSFQSQLAVEIGVQAAVSQGIQTISGGVSYLAYGDFLIEVFKLDGDKVLVRFVSRQDQEKKISAHWKAGANLAIFPVVLEKEIERLLSAKVEFKAAKAEGHLLVLEYIFDLKNPEAQIAYNEIVDPSLWSRFRDIYKISNPVGDKEKGDDLALLRFQKAEALAQESVGKTNPAVTSQLQGESDYRRTHRGIKANILIAKSHRSKNFIEMDFDFKDVKGEDKAFRISNLTLSQGRSFLFDTLRRKSIQQVDAVLSLTPEPVLGRRSSESREILDFQSLVVSCSRDEKTRHVMEQEGLDAALRRMVPERYHQHLDTTPIRVGGLQADARTEVSLVMDRSAFLQGSRLSAQQIREVILKHLNLLRKKAGPFGGGLYGNTWGHQEATGFSSDPLARPKYPKGFPVDAWVWTNLEDINEILNELPEILHYPRGLSDDALAASKVERWKNFISLRHNHLFKIIGPGLLTRVVDKADRIFGHDSPDSNFPTGVSLSMRTVFRKFHGDKSQNVMEVKLGDSDQFASYRAIDRIRRQVLNTEFRIEDYDDAFEAPR